jgi:outer membrane protein
LGALGEPQTNLSIQGTIPQSTGTPVPIFDPSIVGQLNWMHQNTQQLDILSYGVPSLVANGFNANAGLVQSFVTGAQVNLAFNNTHQSLNALDTNYNPYTGSSLGLTVTQPLGTRLSARAQPRFIRIAANDRKINTLLFHQQLIATVYGVIRLYTDFVALYEDVKVKQETVTAAEKLYSDSKAQVDEGTLAPVELTRANAQLFATRQDLINSRGVLEEQQAILKNLLTRTGNADPEVQAATIIPTDPLRYSRERRDPAHTGSVHRSPGQSPRSGPGQPADREFPDRPEGSAERHAARGGPGRHRAEQRLGRPAEPACAGYGNALHRRLWHGARSVIHSLSTPLTKSACR